MLLEGTKAEGRRIETREVGAMMMRIGRDVVIETYLRVYSTKWGWLGQEEVNPVLECLPQTWVSLF